LHFKNGVVGNVGQGSMICEMGNRVTGEIKILVLELVLGSKVLISSETRAPRASYRTLVLMTDGAVDLNPKMTDGTIYCMNSTQLNST